MSSANFFSGYAPEKPTSRVLAPPGGRSNNIFGGPFEDDRRNRVDVEPVKNIQHPPLVVGPTPQQAAAANRNHNQQSSVVFGDDQKVGNKEDVGEVQVSSNKTSGEGLTPQEAAAFNKNKHQQSSVVFGGDDQVVNKKASNGESIKQSILTPQQQATANKNHNQQSSVVFGDGTNHMGYGSSDHYQHQKTNRITNETVDIKDKQQRCTFNPITGQAY